MPILPAVSCGRVVKAYTAMKAQSTMGHEATSFSWTPYTPRSPARCFSDWSLLWDPAVEKKCICGKKVFHLTNMNGGSGKWLLFGTGNGISWVRDGDSEPEAASACGDVQSKV